MNTGSWIFIIFLFVGVIIFSVIKIIIPSIESLWESNEAQKMLSKSFRDAIESHFRRVQIDAERERANDELVRLKTLALKKYIEEK